MWCRDVVAAACLIFGEPAGGTSQDPPACLLWCRCMFCCWLCICPGSTTCPHYSQLQGDLIIVFLQMLLWRGMRALKQ